MLGRAQISARRKLLSVVPISIALFSTAYGDGTTSIDTTAQTISIAYGTTSTGRRALVPVVVGKRYRVSWTYTGTTGMQLYAGTAAGGLQYRPNIANDLFFDFTATTTDLHLGFQRIATGTTTVSNLTIQEIPAVTWADTSLITPAGWVSISPGVTIDQTTGAMTIASTGSLLSARQGFTTTVGKLYRARWNNSIAGVFCLIGSSNGGSQMKSAASSDSSGDKTYEFRATTTQSWLQYQRSTTGTAVVSNIFVQETV